jgi:octanoyl-[GcvH]:protein N-octanoyltransferase
MVVIDRGGTSPVADMAAIKQTLDALHPGASGILRVHRPAPTAAFCRRDTRPDGYPAAAEAVRACGFEPVLRRTGGRLAAYHGGALVLDLVTTHHQPRRDMQERFRLFAQALVAALRTVGVDARVGPVPGEYCPGTFSVNAAGRVKLAGTAQRLTRHGYHFGAVLIVRDAAPIRAALEAAYPLLGLPFEPSTVGSVTDHVVGVDMDDVQAAVLAEIGRLLPLDARQLAAS